MSGNLDRLAICLFIYWEFIECLLRIGLWLTIQNMNTCRTTTKDGCRVCLRPDCLVLNYVVPLNNFETLGKLINFSTLCFSHLYIMIVLISTLYT
jgi:hypothetical protein